MEDCAIVVPLEEPEPSEPPSEDAGETGDSEEAGVQAEDAAAGVADDEHEAGALAAVLGGFGVEGGEGAAVLLEGVGELPVFGELQAGRDEEADFFGDGFA